jgi:iron complex transport system substrate-binding protein
MKILKVQRFWSIFLGICLLLVACQSPTVTFKKPLDCMEINHSLGRSCVPRSPQRLVALDTVALENALTLGVKPIGSVRSELDRLLSPYLIGMENIGKVGSPNLENILLLKPDLILGHDFTSLTYTLLQAIAPTILLPFEHSGEWQKGFLNTAKALGKNESAQSLLQDFRQKLDIFREVKDQKISVVRIYPDRITVYLQDSFIGTILGEAGFSRPQGQAISAELATQKFGNPIQVEVSKENLMQIDGDVIFVWLGESTADSMKKAQLQLDKLQNDPLWLNLNAVKQGRVYNVPRYWIGSGLIAANAVVEDLIKYLIDKN